MTTNQPRRFRAQYSIGLLMLIMFVVSVAAASFGGLNRGGDSRALFVMFTLAAPVTALIVVSAWQYLTRKR